MLERRREENEGGGGRESEDCLSNSEFRSSPTPHSVLDQSELQCGFLCFVSLATKEMKGEHPTKEMKGSANIGNTKLHEFHLSTEYAGLNRAKNTFFEKKLGFSVAKSYLACYYR